MAPGLTRQEGVDVSFDPGRAAVLALHWQVNVIKPEGFFGGMLSEPVARSGVIDRAARFHAGARNVGLPIFFTRFVIPEGEGGLVRNTDFMCAVGDAQEAFRPTAPGAQLIPEVLPLAEHDWVVDNQKLSGFAGSDLPDILTTRGIDTVFITGVATNLTVEQTARHGTELGFTVHPVSDCVMTATEEAHRASLANLDLVTAGCRTAAQILALLSQADMVPARKALRKGFACSRILVAYSGSCGEATGARRRPADGGNLEQRGGLPLCGGLTLVFKGQSTTIGKSTTLMQSQAARWRIVSPMPHASSSRYQAAAGRWPARHIRTPGQ